MTAPPFAHFGGKTTLAQRIVSLLPAHEHYVEPFAGSLAVLLAKPRTRMETVNDLDGDLMLFWRVLRERPGDLERVCALTPHSRAEHQASYEAADDELEAARRTWVKLTQGRGRQMRRTGWRHYQDAGRAGAGMPSYLAAYVGRIAPAAERLTGVSLECRPALDLIRTYGRHTSCLLYCDPPYPQTVRSSSRDAYAVDMGTEAEHEALIAALLACNAAVVLSGYTHPMYEEMLAGWDREDIPTTTGQGGSRGARTEVLWSNRPLTRDNTLQFGEVGA